MAAKDDLRERVNYAETVGRRRDHFGFSERRPRLRGWRRRRCRSRRNARQQHLPAGRLLGSCARSSSLVSDPVDLAGKQLPAQRSSPAGALGIAQFMPATAGSTRARRSLRSRSRDPQGRLAVGRTSAAVRQSRSRRGGLQRRPRRVAKWLAKAGELPIETQNYVSIITRHPIDEWAAAGGATKLEEDKVFPESSCVQNIAVAARRSEPMILAHSVVLGALGGPDSGQLQQERGAAAPTCGPDWRLCLYSRRHQTNDHRRIFWLPRLPPVSIAFARRRRRAPQADALCAKLLKAGGACVVLRS